MTFDTLKETAHSLLETIKTRLVDEHEIDPLVTIVGPDDSMKTIALDGRIMERRDKKEALMALLKVICNRTKAQGLILVTDGWTLDQTDAQKDYTATEEGNAKLLHISGEGGVVAAAAAGLGTLMETIICVAQMPKHNYSLMQMYQRVAADGVIPGSAVLQGGPQVPYTIRFHGGTVALSSENGGVTRGRLMGVFDPDEEDEEEV